jgi:polysaccharide export outer membrane protein
MISRYHKLALSVVVFAGIFLSGCGPALRSNGMMENTSGGGSKYLFGPDDVISISVSNHPEWSDEYKVKPDGKLTIKNLGEVNAQGLNREELKSSLKDFFNHYINDPIVTIEVIDYVSQVIYVMGEVSSPGKYPTGGKRVTLRDAIIDAGLPTRFAALGRVFIMPAGNKKKRVINLYRILYKGELGNNIVLNHGDVVYVPRNLLGVLNEFVGILVDPMSSYSDARTAIVQ